MIPFTHVMPVRFHGSMNCVVELVVEDPVRLDVKETSVLCCMASKNCYKVFQMNHQKKLFTTNLLHMPKSLARS